MKVLLNVLAIFLLVLNVELESKRNMLITPVPICRAPSSEYDISKLIA